MAIAMLTQLAGNTHYVLTSIAVKYQHHLLRKTQRAGSAFAPAERRANRAAYCDSAEPRMTRLAAMAFKAWRRFIEHISGSYSGIMGLPLGDLRVTG